MQWDKTNLSWEGVRVNTVDDTMDSAVDENNPIIMWEKQKKEERAKKKRKDDRFSSKDKYRRIKKYGKVWEFGDYVDLQKERDVHNFLVHLNDWIKKVKIPSDHVRFMHMARKFVKNKYHRVVALTIIANEGNKKAKMFLHALSGLNAEDFRNEFDQLNTKGEMQCMDSTVLISMIPTFIMLMALFTYYKVKPAYNRLMPAIEKMGPAIEKVTELAGKASTTMDSVGGAMDSIGGVIEKVSEIATQVWSWFKDLCKKMLNAFALDTYIGKAAFKMVIKILLAVLAFKYAKTIFPFDAKEIIRYFAGKLGLVTTNLKDVRGAEFEEQIEKKKVIARKSARLDEAWNEAYDDEMKVIAKEKGKMQGGGKKNEPERGYIAGILNFIRKNLKIKRDVFWACMEKIPKVVNCAKAMQWIFENIVNIYNRILEAWTGKPRGRNKFERAIQEFDAHVHEFDLIMKTRASIDIFSQKTISMCETLLLEKKTVERMALNSGGTIRPYFGNILATAARRCDDLHTMLELRRRQASKRPEPVWVWINGAPGVGKTHALERLYVDIWSYVKKFQNIERPIIANEEEWSFGHVFIWNQAEEFFEGYNGQFYFVVDDLFQLKEVEARSRVASQFINMIAPSPYSLRVATVEQKAFTFFTSRCMITTSNLGFDLKGQNLGLESPKALESRRTVSVEMIGTDSFVLDPNHRIEGVNDKDRVLTQHELAALIGECILHNEEKVHVMPHPDEFEERWNRGFLGGRIELPKASDKGIMQAGGIDDEKPNSPKPKEEESPKKDKGKDKIRELVTTMGKVMDDEELDEFILSRGGKINSANPCYEEYLVRRERVNDGIGTEEDVNYCYERITIRTRIERFIGETMMNLSYSDEQMEEFVSLCFLARNEHQEIKLPYVTNESIIKKMGFMSAAFKMHFKWYPKMVPLAMAFSSIFGIEVEETGKGRWWALYRGMLCPRNKLIFFPNEKEEPVIDLNFWFEAFKDNEKYWKDIPAIDLKRDQDIAPSLYVSLMVDVAFFTAVAFVVSKLLRTIMPAAAYNQKGEPQGGNYDGAKVKLPSKTQIRRVRAREIKRIKQMAAPREVGIAQAGQPRNYDKIMRNSEMIYVRVGKKGDTWEDVKGNDPICRVWALCVFRTTWMLPLHALFAFTKPEDTIWISMMDQVDYHCGLHELIPFKNGQTVVELRGDIGLIKLPNIAERKDITGLFEEQVPTYGKFEHLVKNENNTSYQIEIAMNWENKHTEIEVPIGYEPYTCDVAFYGIHNEAGMCGTVYCSRSDSKIIAIHNGGHPEKDVGLGVLMFKSDLMPYKDEDVDQEDAIYGQMECGPVVKGVNVLGLVEKRLQSYVPSETNIKLSQFDYGSFPVPETTDSPAILKCDGEISPLKLAVAKFGLQERVPIAPEEPLLDDFLPQSFNPNNIRTITLEEAIYGIPGYMNSIDMNTSAGYYWKRLGKTRRQLCYDKDGNQRVHYLLRRDIEVKMERFRKGRITPVMFEETLKDELRDEDRVRNKKTRLFSAGDFSSFLIQRMVLGTFVVEATKDPVGSACALGLNPHSKQWGQLYARLKGLQKRLLGAGDFGSFDISVKNDVRDAFIRLVRKYHPEPKLAENVILSNFLGWHICGRLVFQRPWGTSSGSFITSIFNSFANWYIHKKAFIHIYREEDWKNVETTFTGDDSVFTVPVEFGQYNMAYLQDYFYRYYRMTYTSPTKTNDLNVSWEDLTYLKRQFVRGHAGVMAPLKLGSIANMVKWTERVNDLEVMESVCNSVLLEAWHYGEDFYNECYVWIVKECRRLGVHWRFPDFKGMRTLRQEDYAF